MTQFIKLIFLSSFIALYGCGENGILESSGSGNIRAVDGASQWDESLFPLKVKVSSDFSASEKSGMADVGKTWGLAHGNQTFLNLEILLLNQSGNLLTIKMMF